MLEHHWPGVPVHTDLAELDPADLAPVDVLVGGTPCQNFSQAGNRLGLDGEKSSLFHHYVRIRDAIQPIYAVWENVVGALSTNGGRDFAAVLGAFVGSPVTVPGDGWRGAGVAVGDGGWAVWRILDAQWFGVAQRRRRVIVVSSTRTEPRPEILLESEGVRWNPPARGESRSRVAVDARAGVADGSPEGGAIARCLTTSAQRIDADTETFVVGTLMAHDSGGWRIGADDAAANHIVAVPATSPTLTSGGHDSSEDGTNRHTLVAQVAATLTSGSSNPGASAPGRRQEDDVNLVPVAFAENQRGELVESDVAKSLTVGGGKPGQGYAAVREGVNVRRLTPMEYERLQGFPDGWTIDPDMGLKTPDSRRYAACGDAVAVPVAKWIAERIAVQHG